jgi:sporulation protein YlmC with PRC-barrel domain
LKGGIKMAEDEKKYSKQIIGKMVVTKSGKRFGEVGNITFETRTGELLQIILKNPTSYAEGLELEKDKSGLLTIPYSAVIAIGDFVVVSEEDIL